jgi:hypothetical protein
LSAHVIFASGVGWNFSIIVMHGKMLQKYTLNPDFMLVPSYQRNAWGEWKGFCPILLGEVVSYDNERDQWRMLLQLAVCACVNGLVAKANHPPFIIQAVYLSKAYQAEHYLAYADTTELVGLTSDCHQG